MALTAGPRPDLVVRPDPARTRTSNQLPLGATNLVRAIPGADAATIETPLGRIPFTLEHTGFPVLKLRAGGGAELPPANVAPWIVPLLAVFESYVQDGPVEERIFSPVFRRGPDARRDPGTVSAKARGSANNLFALCRSAGSKALTAPAGEFRQRRLEQPLETALEILCCDPDHLPAYAWAAQINLALGYTSLAFDFFLTLVMRMRLFERILANAALDPAGANRNRIRQAVAGRVDAAFWPQVTQLADALCLRGQIGLEFPNLARLAAGG